CVHISKHRAISLAPYARPEGAINSASNIGIVEHDEPPIWGRTHFNVRSLQCGTTNKTGHSLPSRMLCSFVRTQVPPDNQDNCSAGKTAHLQHALVPVCQAVYQHVLLLMLATATDQPASCGRHLAACGASRPASLTHRSSIW